MKPSTVQARRITNPWFVGLVVVATTLIGCDPPLPPDPPPAPTEELVIVDDLYSSHLATATQSDGTRLAIYGERDAEGLPTRADFFELSGPDFDGVGGIRLDLDIDAQRGTMSAGNGSNLDYHRTANGDSVFMRYYDAETQEVEEFSIPWEAPRKGRVDEKESDAITTSLALRSFRLFCPGGQPYRGAVSAIGNISVSGGEWEYVRISRSRSDPSIFTYQLPASLQALATPAGCTQLYTALERILASSDEFVLRELCLILQARIRNIRGRAAVAAFCTAARAILSYVQRGDRTGITPACRQALAREISDMDVEILTFNGWMDTSLPIEWSNPAQTNELIVDGLPGDRVQWAGPRLNYGKVEFGADIQSWCVDRTDTEFHLEVFPFFAGGGWASEPVKRVFGVPSLNGRTRLFVEGLIPCIGYLAEVTRKDLGRSTTVATKIVTPSLDDVDRIHWDPTGFVLGAQRFTPESQFEVQRSRSYGYAPHYMTLVSCDENGRTNTGEMGWHSIRFFNSILPDVQDLEVFCDQGPGMRFKAVGTQTGLGIRDGRPVGYRATGTVSFQVVYWHTHDEVSISFQCDGEQNCDLAQEVSLTLHMPRDQARWAFYPYAR